MDVRQMRTFADGMKEFMDDFWDGFDLLYDGDEVYEYEGIDGLDPDDYDRGNDSYETKVKAKIACKEVIELAEGDLSSVFENAKTEILEGCEEIIGNVEEIVSTFSRQFSASYDDYISLECEGETAEYLAGLKDQHFCTEVLEKTFQDIGLRKKFSKLGEEELAFPLEGKKYYEQCSYERDDEGYYCFDVGDVVAEMSDTVESFLDEKSSDMICETGELCVQAIIQLYSHLWLKLDGLKQPHKEEHSDSFMQSFRQKHMQYETDMFESQVKLRLEEKLRSVLVPGESGRFADRVVKISSVAIGSAISKIFEANNKK